MGQKFASYDASGKIIGFYDSVDSPAPAGAAIVAITEAQWLECISTHGYTVRDGIVVAPNEPTYDELLAQAREIRLATLADACGKAIVSGFNSTALGEAYGYPSTLTDQVNLGTVASCAAGGQLWCSYAGSWCFKVHTQAQAQAVLATFTSWLNKCQEQLVALGNRVSDATTVSAVEAVNWFVPA